VQNVAGYGEQESLGTPDGFVMLDSHEPQENLLRQIGRVGAIAQP
jgi:hypothetical protein